MKNENRRIARLIKQIQRGNQSAFEEFYKLTSQKAYFIALKITQNEHDAEDVLQESYIKALEKINEIDTSQNISSWFLKIVSNKSKDVLKSKSRFVFDSEEEGCFDEIPEEKAEFCPEESLNQEELRLEIMAAIDELTDEKRACIMMMYFGDMSVKEIAESIEVPESTVKNRLHTARKDLKTRFEKNGNMLYGAALGGVLAWALNKTSVTASAAFLASAASAEIVAGATAAASTAATATTAAASTAAATTAASTATTAAATAATATAATTAATTGAGIAAKIAVVSVAQKIVVGVAATAVIGGSTAGVVTVVKNADHEKETTTVVTEAVTTAPEILTEYVFNEITFPETTSESASSTEKETTRETAKRTTVRAGSEEHTTAPAKETSSAVKTEQTSKREKTTKVRTTKAKTTEAVTTTAPTETTAHEETTEETTTREATTERKETTTQKPETTTKATTVPTTTEPTTKAKATLIIEVTDFDNSVVATITETVDEGTEITRDYIVSLVRTKGYEAMAGVYGDAIGSVAQGGQTYNFTAEL